MEPVIYRIRNLVNDKFYVGSTVNKKVRYREHRKQLRGNRHHCKHLQAAWNMYGEEKFIFEVLEVIADPAELNKAEDKWLNQWHNKPECYNSGATAVAPWRGTPKEQHPQFGVPKSDSTKQEISKTLKEFYSVPGNHPRYGKTHTEESKRKISENRKGKNAGVDHYRYGQTLSDEVKAKISAAQLGKPKAPRTLTAEGKAKIKAAAEAGHYSNFTGKKHTEEARLKMSKAVIAVAPDGTESKYDSITALRADLGLTTTTVHRVIGLDTGLKKGAKAGWKFRYAD